MIRRILRFQHICQLLSCLILTVHFSASVSAQNDDHAKSPSSALHATHILGFEGMARNANGDLSIQDDALRFQTSEGASAQIALKSIEDVSFGEEDKEEGGTPMAVTRAAVPFGGGRVIGLFAHKKFDTVTLQYLDPEGGSHGAIFQLDKGQGQVLKTELEGQGVRVAVVRDRTDKSKRPGEKK
jgi:hypothetical protein